MTRHERRTAVPICAADAAQAKAAHLRGLLLPQEPPLRPRARGALHDLPAEPPRGARPAAAARAADAPAALGIRRSRCMHRGPSAAGALAVAMVWPSCEQRDLFANFARMTAEMDQMLGDDWGRTTYVSRRSTGFSPNVDVYYCGDPQRAVVKVDLAGVEPRRGRDRGQRPAAGDRRRAAGAGDRGAGLPAGRDSLRGRSGGSSSCRSRSTPSARRRPTRTACCGSTCRCATRPRPPAGCR